jgi:hypothetical protein
MTVVRPTPPAILSPPVFAIDDLSQAVGARDGTHDYISAVAAIAPIGTAARHVLFPPKAATPRAAITAFDEQCHSINEHGRDKTTKYTKETKKRSKDHYPDYSRAGIIAGIFLLFFVWFVYFVVSFFDCSFRDFL